MVDSTDLWSSFLFDLWVLSAQSSLYPLGGRVGSRCLVVQPMQGPGQDSGCRKMQGSGGRAGDFYPPHKRPESQIQSPDLASLHGSTEVGVNPQGLGLGGQAAGGVSSPPRWTGYCLIPTHPRCDSNVKSISWLLWPWPCLMSLWLKQVPCSVVGGRICTSAMAGKHREALPMYSPAHTLDTCFIVPLLAPTHLHISVAILTPPTPTHWCDLLAPHTPAH